MDWEFAFRRSEMLRQFKAELLVNLGHELRGPLSSQIGALDLILTGLCESVDEMQEFAAAARNSAQGHIHLIADCIELSRYESPILPLHLQQVELASTLQQIYQLTEPIARDRGLQYDRPEMTACLQADPHWLEQALLGMVMWGFGQIVHGSVRFTLEPLSDIWQLSLSLSGKLRVPLAGRDSLYWQVPQAAIAAMSGQLLLAVPTQAQSVVAICCLPRRAIAA